MGSIIAGSPAIPWDKLLAWVHEQMAIESDTGRPAPLTQSQLEALSALVQFHAEPPAVDDTDYVSKLMQRTQATRAKAPVFTDLQPVNVPIDGHMQPRWRCVCTLAQHGSFPRQGHGMVADEDTPVFTSKKMAKQFAAKHALSYLTQVGSVAPRSAAATPVLSRGSSASGAAVSPATPDLEPGGPSSSIFRDVSAISTRLGIESPSYLVEPDADNAGFFTARPVFKKATHVPVDMTVTGVQGHKQAKQRAAELAWDWMDSELQKRQAVYKNLWAS